jgi:hypothetical protein
VQQVTSEVDVLLYVAIHKVTRAVSLSLWLRKSPFVGLNGGAFAKAVRKLVPAMHTSYFYMTHSESMALFSM